MDVQSDFYGIAAIAISLIQPSKIIQIFDRPCWTYISKCLIKFKLVWNEFGAWVQVDEWSLVDFFDRIYSFKSRFLFICAGYSLEILIENFINSKIYSIYEIFPRKQVDR